MYKNYLCRLGCQGPMAGQYFCKIKIKICYNNDAIANHVPILSLLRLEYCIALTVHFKKITLFTTLKGPPQIKPIRSLLPCKALVVFDDN